MLSHLLARDGMDGVVVDNRTHTEIEQTVRAGILEHRQCHVARRLRSVRPGAAAGRRARRHRDRGSTGSWPRIDFADLVGSSVWLYPQTDVFIDLAAARSRDGGDVRFGVTDTSVDDLTGDLQHSVHRRGRPPRGPV